LFNAVGVLALFGLGSLPLDPSAEGPLNTIPGAWVRVPAVLPHPHNQLIGTALPLAFPADGEAIEPTRAGFVQYLPGRLWQFSPPLDKPQKDQGFCQAFTFATGRGNPGG
jgi:hypothetical protein